MAETQGTIYRERVFSLPPVILFAAGLILSLTGCSDKPKIVQHSEVYSGIGLNAVYVVSHGWHTGFVIPSAKVYETIPSLERRFGGSDNIEFGWGDKHFYQAKEITMGLAARAILWPTETVVHTVAVPGNVTDDFGNSRIALLCLDDKAIGSLLKFVSNSFSVNSLGEPVQLAKGVYGDSQFYKGAGDYHILNTCNEWTAKGLKSIGMDISPVASITAESVMNYLSEKSLTVKDTAEPETPSGCVAD